MALRERKSAAGALERIVAPFEVKSAGAKGEIAGYGSIFGNVDLGRDVVIQGAFKRTLGEWAAKKQLPPMRYEHEYCEPVGDWLSMVEDDVGLSVTGAIWVDGTLPPTEASIKSWRIAKGTGPKGLSIGYRTIVFDYDKAGNRLLKDVDLCELSVVSYAMNPEAIITSAKSQLIGSDGRLVDIRTAERVLRETLGLSVKQSKAFLADGFKAITVKEDRDGLTNDELRDLNTNLNSLLAGIKDTIK